MTRRKIVFHHPSTSDAAKKIAEKEGARIGELPWLYFDDGWPKLTIGNAQKLRGADVTFVASFHDLDVVFEQLAVIFALPKYHINSLEVRLMALSPNVETSSSEEGIVNYRETLLYMLSWTPSTKTGLVSFKDENGDDPVREIMEERFEERAFGIRFETCWDREDFDPIIFSSPSYAKLAKDVADGIGATCGHFAIDSGCENSYAVRMPSELWGKDVIFLASFGSARECFEQLAQAYHLTRSNTRSFTFVLPFFPVGTMERVSVYGEIATAKTMARLISAIPMVDKIVPSRVIIVDIHALGEQFYFEDTVLIDLQSAMPMLIADYLNRDDVVFVFPDDGAHKRYEERVKGKPVVICNKVHLEGNEKQVVIKDGNPKGLHAVLLDDLKLSGKTLKECGKVVLNAGALSISACIPHIVSPNRAWEILVGTFAEVRVTDSVPKTIEQIADVDTYKVKTLAPLIINILEQ